MADGYRTSEWKQQEPVRQREKDEQAQVKHKADPSQPSPAG